MEPMSSLRVLTAKLSLQSYSSLNFELLKNEDTILLFMVSVHIECHTMGRYRTQKKIL